MEIRYRMRRGLSGVVVGVCVLAYPGVLRAAPRPVDASATAASSPEAGAAPPADSGAGLAPDGGGDASDAGAMSSPAISPADPYALVRVCTDPDSAKAHLQRAECFRYRSRDGQVPPLLYALWVLDGLTAIVVTWLLWKLFGLIYALTGAEEGNSASGEGATNTHLKRAFQAIVFIPAVLIGGAHLYGISSYLLGFTYLADFARPAIVSVGMLSVGFFFGALFGLPNRSRASPGREPDGDSEGSPASGGSSVAERTPRPPTGENAGAQPQSALPLQSVSTSSSPAPAAPAMAPAAPTGAKTRPSRAAAGTVFAEFGDRLDQIADWLTKLLLGAGLTQLHSLWDRRAAINSFFARATAMRTDAPLGTILAFASLGSGFLLGYVAALLFLPVALHAGLKEIMSMVGHEKGSKR
jgi:hypothetical protein